MTIRTAVCDDSHVSTCCPHPEEEHRLLATCQEVIHYPSEDYPCLCEGFEGERAKCEECSHAREKHVVVRVCGKCECRT